MRRLTREALRMRIWIGLTVTKQHKKRAFGLDVERARDEITDDLLDRIMGPPASEAVVLIPDMVGSPLSPVHGKWDIDEPHPHPHLSGSDH